MASTVSPIKNFALSLRQQAVLSAASANAVTVKVGVPFDLELVLTDASQLILLQSYLQYDTARLEVVTSDGLPFWENGTLVDDPEDFTVTFVNQQAGILSIAAMPPGTGTTIEGSGRLMTIRFVAKQSGLTNLVWLPDSAAYVPDDDPILLARKTDATFKGLDLGIDPAIGSLIITLNVVPV